MAAEFCPRCGTARVGALRFCRSCAFDYEALPPPELRAAEEPRPTEAVPEPIAQAAPAVTTTGSGRRPWVILGVVIFVAIVAAAGFIAISASGALAPHHDVTGTFTLVDTNTQFPSISVTGGTCKGTGGYSDLGPGTPVTLKNGEGKLLATTTLGLGSGSITRCQFSFALGSVPEESFYTLAVGRRGDLSYSLEDMKSQNWEVGGTIGS